MRLPRDVVLYVPSKSRPSKFVKHVVKPAKPEMGFSQKTTSPSKAS